jgi:Holliday junction resolvasome RuvABC DNA-binding subunit
MREDVVSALVNLGYQQSLAEKAVGAVLKETADANFTATLKQALRTLAK